MGKIKVLDENISSKIAAGEIIEKPVSVVKELVENSIDAGSRHIFVEIEKGGKSLIKVIDDGEGMDPEDVRLAFERHATSKISSLDDIFNIKTLGFRGEALPSIAAVSLLTVLTKTHGSVVGTKCVLNGGVIEKFEEAAVAEGCCVIVRNIFFNTPARLKFLQSDSREASLVVDLVTRYAIGHPDISFRLSVDGKEVLYTPGNGNLKEVIARIYGFNLAKDLIHINKTFDFGRIDGFISPPKYTRGNRSWETFFVNGRLVKDRGLSASLEKAYRTLLPGDKFPIAFIKISIDGSLVDVNVHPAKIEIRFQRENEVHQALYETVKEGLFSNTLVPKEDLPIPKTTFPKPKNYDGAVNENFLKEEYFTRTSGKIENKPVFTETAVPSETKKHSAPNIKEEKKAPEIYFSRILGQLFETYIVVQGNGEFYLVDQHAAHERILYEYYSCGMDLPVISQELVSPFILKLTFEEINFIEENRDFIKRMGFDIEVFGKDTVLIRSVPYFFNKPVEPASLQEIMDELKENGEFRLRSREKILASMACHTAIKAGDTLSPDEMRELLDQLMRTQNPYTCPHGRPTMISISLYELEKKFRRING